MKPQFAQETACLKGYVTESTAMKFRRLARVQGYTVSSYIKHLVKEDIARNQESLEQQTLF